MERFTHKVYLDGVWPERDNYFALTALVADTIAVYYWCESFLDRVKKDKIFCVMGQRGLAEYAARKTEAVLRQLTKKAEESGESWGWKFGTTCALRDMLRDRRQEEQKDAVYMDQLNASTYRAKKELEHAYKVGIRDVKAHFSVDDYKRGRGQVWTLKKFQTPIHVLNDYHEMRFTRCEPSE